MICPYNRRAPHGARGLKCWRSCLQKRHFCRAPQGARGLKFENQRKEMEEIPVAPRKGRVD